MNWSNGTQGHGSHREPWVANKQNCGQPSMTCYQISVAEGTLDLEMLTSQRRFENGAEVDKFDFRNKLTLGVTRLGMWMEKGRQAVPDEA